MINNVYQLVAPHTIAIKFEEIKDPSRVVVRPAVMALCHADQRYFNGKRSSEAMRKKLPMALIHECMGEVLRDPSGTFSVGEKVVLIPNIPGDQEAGIYENYVAGSGFLSSGYDGFMREFVDLPADRIVSCEGVDPRVAAITEFVSVAVHAVSRLQALAHSKRDRIAIIGDGSLSYVVSCVLDAMLPDSELIVIGRNRDKISIFSHVSKRYLANELPSDLAFDHAFECAGGEGSAQAIDTVISFVRPQGALMLLGVSECPVPVYTRDILEKGMTLVGCSRSGRSDFEIAVSLMRDDKMQSRLRKVIYVDEPVRDIQGIKRIFAKDAQTPFKTVFEWKI